VTDTTLIERCAPALRPGLPALIARKAVHARLSRLTHGRLRLRDGGETHAFGNGDGIESSITVLDPAFYGDVALGGSVGAGESYVQGRWRSDDLTGAMRLMLQNGEALGGMERGLARLSAPLHRFAHALRRNTRAGSRRNISAHYDVGNDFYRLMLDETMMYSCALFERPDMSLAEAQVAKLDRLCRALDLGPSDHVLEIGTGWGGFAIHAAGRYGCRVTTTTISPAQFELARERVARAGLADRVTLLAEDYRDLRGRYDKLASIEMIEAIGHPQYGQYFHQAAALLPRGGRMALQSITIADRHYGRTRDEVDFIKRYIFPGACIPSVSALASAMAASSDLRIVSLEDIGPHYATTLAAWRRNFMSQLPRVRDLGYTDEFIRLWEFYLCYCEAGFAERQLGDVQMILAREG
jgi:cyclopropane-fatty-acyl-phospholipid synthase